MPRSIERAWGLVVLGVAASVAATAGCGRFRQRPAPPLKPPIEAYKNPEWKSFKGEVFLPPPGALKPWRAMMLQEWPRPKKNPKWVQVPVEQALELEMPKGSRFRCLVNPAEIRAQEDEVPIRPEGWRVVRAVRCSNDGWRSSSKAAASVSFTQDGAQAPGGAMQAELYLHDVILGKATRITLLLKPG